MVFRLTECPSWDVPSCCELDSGVPKIGKEQRAVEDADVVPFSDEKKSSLSLSLSLSFTHHTPDQLFT